MGLFKEFKVVFGLFQAKIEEQFKIPIVNHLKISFKNLNVDKGWRGRGGGQSMWIVIKFYNIIIKSANVDKGGGGEVLIHKMSIKYVCFFTPPFELYMIVI